MGKAELLNEFNEMLQRGIIPVMEFELTNGVWLMVNIEAHTKGLRYYVSEGTVSGYPNNFYAIAWDDHQSLDYHLQAISEDILTCWKYDDNYSVTIK